MTDQNRDDAATGVDPSSNPRSASQGRRRFFVRGSKLGAGVVAMTIHHRRSFGQNLADGLIWVSGDAACTSLGGQIADPVDTNGNPVPPPNDPTGSLAGKTQACDLRLSRSQDIGTQLNQYFGRDGSKQWKGNSKKGGGK